MPALNETAPKIIQRFFAFGDEEVVGGQALDASAAVVETTDSEWQVQEVSRADGPGADSYTLYELRPTLVVSPPARPSGVAVFADGAMFHLNNADALRDFWRRAHAAVAPETAALLLARYQGRGPTFERNQNLILDVADLREWVEDADIAGAGGVAPLRVQERGDGGYVLAFCTFFLGDGGATVGINAWGATADGRGGLEWSASPLAQGLASAFGSHD